MAETLTLSSALGLDPHLVVATIADGPLASAYATNKGTAMLDAQFAPASRCSTPPRMPRSLPTPPTTTA